MGIKQISVFLTDEPGTLAQLTGLLNQNDINLRALSVADSQDFGIVRMITDNTAQTVAVLEDAGYVCSVISVLALAIEDRPGAMFELLNKLGEAKVNIEYSYAFTTPVKGQAYLVARVEDLGSAEKALTDAGVTLLDAEELLAN